MRQLLKAIKSALKARLNYLADSEIFFAIHEDVLPVHIQRLGLGIKDGPIIRKEKAGGLLEITMSVKLALWSGRIDEDDRLLGSNSSRGILEFAEDVHEILDENLLGIEGMEEAFSPAETESGPYGNKTRTMQRKIITYQYVKEEERP